MVTRYWRADATKPVADSPSAPAIALKTAMIIAIHFLIPLGSTFCVLMMLTFYCAKIHIYLNMEDFFFKHGSMFHEEHPPNGLNFSTLQPSVTAPATANVPKLPQQYFAGVRHPHH